MELKKLYKVKVIDYFGNLIYESNLTDLDMANYDFNEKVKTLNNNIENNATIMLEEYIEAPEELKEFTFYHKNNKNYFVKEIKRERIKGIMRDENYFDYYKDLLCIAVSDLFYEDVETQDFNIKEMDKIYDLLEKIKENEDKIKESIKE